jgi:hypothetical protein
MTMLKNVPFLSTALLGLLALTLAPAPESKAGDPYVYPPMLLQVPFLPQVPPGDWGATKNCGQTCSVMLKCYFSGSAPSSGMITGANAWLAKRFDDKRYADANGYYTGFSGRGELSALLKEFYGLSISGPSCGTDVCSVLKEIYYGRPCVVGVRISSGRLVSSGGVAHWVLVIGWNPKMGEVILNDPGTRSGRMIAYKVADFEASWKTSSRVYVPVRK